MSYLYFKKPQSVFAKTKAYHIFLFLFFFIYANTILAETDSTVINFEVSGKTIGILPNYIASKTDKIYVHIDSILTKELSNNLSATYPYLTDSNKYGILLNQMEFDSAYNNNDQINTDLTISRALGFCFIKPDFSYSNYYKSTIDKIKNIKDNANYEVNGIPIKNKTTELKMPFEKIVLKQNILKNQITKAVYVDLYKEKYYPLPININFSDIISMQNKMSIIYNDILNSNFENKMLDQNLIINITDFNKANANKIVDIKTYIKQNEDWIKQTAFINGVPTLNPLGFTDTNEINERLSILNELMNNGINTEQQIAILNKLLKNNEQIKNTWATQSYILNELYLCPTKNNKEITYMRHHDASNSIKCIDNNLLPFNTNLYDVNENVKIILHNIKPDLYNPYFKETITSINDTSLFTGLMYPFLNDFLKHINSNRGNFNLNTSSIKKDNNKSIDKVKISISDINNFISNFAMVSWFSLQTTPQPYPEEKLLEPNYKSVVYEAIPAEKKSSIVDYKLGVIYKKNNKDSIIAKFQYRLYKKQYVQFMSMVAFLPVAKNRLTDNFINDRSVIEYKENRFTTLYYKPFDIVLGVKIYPIGMNIRSWMPKFGLTKNKEYKTILKKRGDLVRNRFSILVGLSVSQKQLRNYYAGFGYEIVPGCGINAGINMYSTPYYKIVQNELVSKKEHFKAAYFIGLSFDPIVLTKAFALGKL